MCREDPPEAVSADADRDAGKVPCRGLFVEEAKVLGDPARDFHFAGEGRHREGEEARGGVEGFSFMSVVYRLGCLGLVSHQLTVPLQ